MLLERMTKARIALTERQTADLSQSVVGWHVDAFTRLRDQANRAQSLARTARSLRAKKILNGPLSDRPFTALRGDLASAEKAMREAGDARPDVRLQELVQRTAHASVSAETALQKAWQAYLDRTGAVPAGNDVLKILRQMGLSPVADALGQASRVMEGARARLPVDTKDIDSIDVAGKDVEKAWRKASITPEMVPQVVSMSGPGLPLAKASPELLSWLKERKLDSEVRLRLG